jgi:Domain of unknown function (DUF4397)
MYLNHGRAWRGIHQLLVVVTVLTVVGCGEIKEDAKPAYVRVANVSIDIGAVDITFDDKELAKGLAPNSATSDYREVVTESKTLRVRSSNGTTLFETSITPAKDTRYIYLVTGTDGALNVSIITENESEPSSGKSKLRVMHAAADAGTVDVYVNRTSDSSSFLSSTLTGVAYARATGYYEVDQGAYNVRATVAGDRSDVRLELSNINLADKQRATLVLTPSSGGALVHALLLVQEGTATGYENASGRIRLVAAVDSPAVITAAVSGQPAIGNATSPSVSNYVRLPKGAQTITIAQGGIQARTFAANIAAGSDNTLLVFGPPDNLRITALSDVNRLPTSGTRAFLRTVHAVNGVSGNLTTNADFTPINTGTPYGAASAYTSISGATYSRIDVTEPTSSVPIYIRTDFELAPQTVYTLFMLGNRVLPVGIMRKDR